MLQHKRVALFWALTLLVLTVVPVFAQDAGHIVMWVAFNDNRLDWTQQKAAEFHSQFPDLPEIDVVGKPDTETLSADATTAANEGSLPAIVHYPDAASRNALDSANFTTITDAVAGRTDINGVPTNLRDLIAPITAYYTVNRKLISLPWDVTSAILFSNMTLLNAAGVDTPPATWADVEAACGQIMSGGNHPQYCFTWPNHGWYFEQWMAQQNALFANNNNGRSNRATEVVFNSDAGRAVLAWLVDMKNRDYLYYSGSQGEYAYPSVEQAFESQQVAMAIGSSGDVAAYTNAASRNGYDLRVSRLPYNQNAGWTGNMIGGGSLWLADGLPGDVEDAALTWLFWLTNTENDAEWHQVTGYLPIRASSADSLSASGWANDHPNFLVAADQLNDSRVTNASTGALLGDLTDVRDVVAAAIDKTLNTPNADVGAILDDAASNANRNLVEYNALNAD